MRQPSHPKTTLPTDNLEIRLPHYFQAVPSSSASVCGEDNFILGGSISGTDIQGSNRGDERATTATEGVVINANMPIVETNGRSACQKSDDYFKRNLIPRPWRINPKKHNNYHQGFVEHLRSRHLPTVDYWRKSGSAPTKGAAVRWISYRDRDDEYEIADIQNHWDEYKELESSLHQRQQINATSPKLTQYQEQIRAHSQEIVTAVPETILEESIALAKATMANLIKQPQKRMRHGFC